MAKLRISGKAEEGLRTLTDLPVGQVQSLCAALADKITIKLSIQEDVGEVILDLFPNLSEQANEVLSEAVIGIHFLSASGQRSAKDLADDISLAISKTGDDEDIAQRVEKLTAILAVPSLKASAKAWSLVDEHDKIYIGSRVLTDVRPIFDDSIGDPLKASLVTHTLKVTARVNGSPKNYFIACDNDDIGDLIKNLQRALDKASFLRRIIREYPNQAFGTLLESDNVDE